jgi:uncharacterized protein (DUF2267 family)
VTDPFDTVREALDALREVLETLRIEGRLTAGDGAYTALTNLQTALASIEERLRETERLLDLAREFAADKQTSLVSQWREQAEAAERERDEAIRRYALYSELTEEEAARNVEQYLALASGKDKPTTEELVERVREALPEYYFPALAALASIEERLTEAERLSR